MTSDTKPYAERIAEVFLELTKLHPTIRYHQMVENYNILFKHQYLDKYGVYPDMFYVNDGTYYKFLMAELAVTKEDANVPF